MPTPIQNFLIHKKLWRFLGLVSTPIGLISLALSTSFKQLFGVEWNFMKIFIYTMVSSFIFTIMLFAHKFQPSWSLMLKAQVGFLVFMLTSCSSFLYGKKVNGTPDFFSLVSGGSFALMSLSLSMQIDLGFEVDVFNFFLGFFLVQLMTIHFMLAFVGAVFCYLLMYLRSCFDSQPQNENVVISPNVDEIALEIIEGSRRVQVESGSEFNKEHLYSILGIEEKREEKVIFPMNMEAKIKELCCAGFVVEYSHVYLTWRRQILNEKMLKIELHKLDINEIKNVPLDYIEKKIQRWIMASDYVLRVLLPNEKNITNNVFFGCSSSPNNHADLIFKELCKESMTQLLNFADAVATGVGSPLRLFRIIRVFEALRELLPEIKSLFHDQYSVVIGDEAVAIWEKLRGAIANVFKDLEDFVSSQKIGVVADGGVHPITHYMMNYLCGACKYLRTLEQVFEDNNHHGILSNSNSSSLSFQVVVVRVLELLEKNLKGNLEKMYEDSALCSVFMMNNKRYIIKSAKHSKLREVLGDNWIKNKVLEFNQCFVSYYERSWGNKVIGMLHLDCDDNDESSKHKLGKFIMEFKRMCEVQSTWVIFDECVREKVKSSLKKNLLKEYESFISELGFGPQDIVNGIDNLFHATDELKNHRKMQPTWTIVLPNINDFHEYWWKSSHDIFLDSSSYPM